MLHEQSHLAVVHDSRAQGRYFAGRAAKADRANDDNLAGAEGTLEHFCESVRVSEGSLRAEQLHKVVPVPR